MCFFFPMALHIRPSLLCLSQIEKFTDGFKHSILFGTKECNPIWVYLVGVFVLFCYYIFKNNVNI